MGAKDVMDYTYWGKSSELIYECSSIGYQCSQVYFSNECWEQLVRAQYCVNCHGSSDLFGCVGLRKKQYCILNKQYTKEEYEELVPKIIEHMNEMPYTDSLQRMALWFNISFGHTRICL
jgi:predicted small metal-binding protein